MFKSIFLFESKQWFKNWAFYVYIALFFAIAFFGMASAMGVFDSVTVTTSDPTNVNSPMALNSFLGGFSNLLYFLFPTIIGAAIYRDYKYNTHHILYAYPFSKTSYLLGKFLSGFFITFFISLFIGIGMYLATLIPWGNPEMLGPNLLWNYVQVYLLTIIPNMLFIGIIVFVVTTLSRSVYVGFISIVVLIILLGIINGLLGDMDNRILAALLDPTGNQALNYYTKYWTIHELNTLNLPLGKWYVVNRLIWLGVTIGFVVLLGKLFRFSQHPISFGFKRKGKREIKDDFGGLIRINLPKVQYDFSIKACWSNIWSFTKRDFGYLAKNKMFLIIAGLGILLMVVAASSSTKLFGTSVYPVTRIMLQMGVVFYLAIIIITFLGAGLLVHRGKQSKMDHLIDASPVPNWVLFTSKFFALALLQGALLLVIMVGGILIQAYHGFYHFQIGLYLGTLLGISWVWFIIWGALALFVQTLFKNYIVGFFVLFAFYVLHGFISKLGIEQAIFYFDRLPTPTYSAMNGFGSGLPKYYVYAFYWLLCAGAMMGATLLFWRRGRFSFKERFYGVRKRARRAVILPILICLIGFLGLGGYLYYENTIAHVYYSSKEREQMRAEYEKLYQQYQDMDQPHIVSINIDMALYPHKRNFEATGKFILKNKANHPMDSVLVRFKSDFINHISLQNAQLLSKDTVYGFSFYRLDPPLPAGGETVMKFTTKNKPNTILRDNSPVIENGTFIHNRIFPAIGYSEGRELTDNDIRKKYGLAPQPRMPKQTDTAALQNNYISNDAHWVNFETTVSTSKDQIAIAPGELVKSWTENGRRYFHYKMKRKMVNFYAYNSAAFQVKHAQWKDIDIAVYYHKRHAYNVDRMIKGVKKGLAYYTEAYSPYQYQQIRIVEFPHTLGSYAQSFANTIPFSEAIGFIANVDGKAEDAVDYPFAVTAHEVAHQWWAHQVLGANVRGATMLSESLAEYSALKVLEQEYGKEQMRKFLKDALDKYLRGRTSERKRENPLMYVMGQSYIRYNKGSLVFYALSDYLGEDKLNAVLSDFIDQYAFQGPPYPTSGALVAELEKATPDSLQYLIKDMFKTITLYDNYVNKATYQKLTDDKYKVTIDAVVSKYRSTGKGKRLYKNKKGERLVYVDTEKDTVKSLPLADYIELGIFTKPETNTGNTKKKVLYLKKRKITGIHNIFTVIVDEKPTEVGIDPYNKLIDTRSYDNRKKVDKVER